MAVQRTYLCDRGVDLDLCHDAATVLLLHVAYAHTARALIDARCTHVVQQIQAAGQGQDSRDGVVYDRAAQQLAHVGQPTSLDYVLNLKQLSVRWEALEADRAHHPIPRILPARAVYHLFCRRGTAHDAGQRPLHRHNSS